MTTVIAKIESLPGDCHNNTEHVGIIITSDVPSFFRLIGVGLNDIKSINWYPRNPTSVLFETRQLILLNEQEGTFMIRVTNNYLNVSDRAGYMSFTLMDDSNLVMPVRTYGRVSAGPLWTAPEQGLITG